MNVFHWEYITKNVEYVFLATHAYNTYQLHFGWDYPMHKYNPFQRRWALGVQQLWYKSILTLIELRVPARWIVHTAIFLGELAENF